MNNLPRRVKGVTNEKNAPSQAALRSEITSDPNSSASEEAYLRTLKLKVDLGLSNPAELRGLYPQDSPNEIMTRRVLRNLASMGSMSPQFAMISQQFGTPNRLHLAQQISARMVKSAQLRNVTAAVLGVRNDGINGFGQDVVDANMANQQVAQDPMQNRAEARMAGF